MRAVRPCTSTVPARGIEAGDQVEQGRLAAARGADHADELAGGDVEVDALEGDQRCPARPERLADAADGDGRGDAAGGAAAWPFTRPSAGVSGAPPLPAPTRRQQAVTSLVKAGDLLVAAPGEEVVEDVEVVDVAQVDVLEFDELDGVVLGLLQRRGRSGRA